MDACAEGASCACYSGVTWRTPARRPLSRAARPRSTPADAVGPCERAWTRVIGSLAARFDVASSAAPADLASDRSAEARARTHVAQMLRRKVGSPSVRPPDIRSCRFLLTAIARPAATLGRWHPDRRWRRVRIAAAAGTGQRQAALLRQARAALDDERGERLDDGAVLEALCRISLERPDAVDPSGTRPAYQVAITRCPDCERSTQNGSGIERDLTGPEAERARCDAEVMVAGARVTATISLALRRRVFARDQYRCVVPGCRSARNLDLHHVVFQSHGGRHELSNLCLLCSAHHAALVAVVGSVALERERERWREARTAPRHARVRSRSLRIHCRCTNGLA